MCVVINHSYVVIITRKFQKRLSTYDRAPIMMLVYY